VVLDALVSAGKGTLVVVGIANLNMVGQDTMDQHTMNWFKKQLQSNVIGRSVDKEHFVNVCHD